MSDKPFYALRPLMGDVKMSTERVGDRAVTKVTWPVMGHEFVRVIPKSKDIDEHDLAANALVAKLLDDQVSGLTRQMNTIMSGTTGTMTSWSNQRGITLKDITDAMAAMPPRETWVVSAMFPPKALTVIKTEGENFTCMDQAMWDEASSKLLRRDHTTPTGLGEIRPFFLDSDHVAKGPSKWHADERDRILGKLGKAYRQAAERCAERPQPPTILGSWTRA